MKIESANVKAYRLPPASPWEDATNKVEGLEFLIELDSDAGATQGCFLQNIEEAGHWPALSDFSLGITPEATSLR